MSRRASDRNLLFGILAVQMDFVSRDDLIAAMNAWVLEKGRGLGEILVERGAMEAGERALLEPMVDRHVARHGGDPERSLASLSSVEWMAAEVRGKVADEEVAESLSMLRSAEDGWSTRPSSQVLPPSPPGLRFRKIRDHARGGLGVVFVALDSELNREVALKEIKPAFADHPEGRARFLLEGEITGGLEHPGIVPVYGLGRYEDGRPFYAMRFIKGDSLKEAIDRFHLADSDRNRDPGTRSVELRDLLRRFLDVCNAVAYAHSRGVLHRDLKPNNIMVGRFGETLVVDWGLAKVVGRPEGDGSSEPTLRPSSASGTGETIPNSALGTPGYMSPEQAAGRIDQLGPATDVYSLGATLYAVLVGHGPFRGLNAEAAVAMAIVGRFPRPREANRSVPRALEAVCLKAMAARPGDRYPSPLELAEDLKKWLADERVSAYREPLPARAWRWARRHRTALVAAGWSLVLALAVGGFQVWRRADDRRRADDLVDRLIRGDVADSPALAEALVPLREFAEPRLTRLASSSDRSLALRVSLALLRMDPGRAEGLASRIFVEPPEVAAVLIRQLRPFGDRLSALLPEMARGGGASARLRAESAGVAFSPEASRGPEWFEAVARDLLAEDPGAAQVWSGFLDPFGRGLLVPLKTAYRSRVYDGQRPEEKGRARALIERFAGDDPSLRIDLLPDAEPEFFERLISQIPPGAASAGHPALAPLAPLPPLALIPPLTPDPRPDDALDRRRAQAAVARSRLDPSADLVEFLDRSPDPNLRSHLIRLFGELGGDWKRIRDRLLDRDDPPGVRSALILILGDLSAAIPREARDSLVVRLLPVYRNDRDPGVHGALARLLDRIGAIETRREADSTLARLGPRAGQGWFVAPGGHTMVVVRPQKFAFGSPNDETGRERGDLDRETASIDTEYAIGAREVTWGEFRRFLAATKGKVVHYSGDQEGGLDADDLPAISVTWFVAMQFCRWLSEQEGFGEDQMCYPKVEAIGPGFRPDPVLGQRLGYRLPTEKEWECAARAGASSARSYGRSDALLGGYAVFGVERPARVGTRLPNEWGLFDTLGNVAEWCNDLYETRPDRNGIVAPFRVQRGGSFALPYPGYVRDAHRDGYSPELVNMTVGFRVARFMIAPK